MRLLRTPSVHSTFSIRTPVPQSRKCTKPTLSPNVASQSGPQVPPPSAPNSPQPMFSVYTASPTSSTQTILVSQITRLHIWIQNYLYDALVIYLLVHRSAAPAAHGPARGTVDAESGGYGWRAESGDCDPSVEKVGTADDE
ncbi:MAG: hypothetical protein Q9175_002880 [Cornicularia normoerica]